MYPISAYEVSQILTLAVMILPTLIVTSVAVMAFMIQGQRITYVAVPVHVRVLCPYAHICGGRVNGREDATF